MSEKEIEKIGESIFESIKHVDEYGNEYWFARELMKILEYNKWENFEKVINKSIESCKNSGISTFDCFPDVRKSIITGKGKETIIKDYKLTRYACYLIAQNGDPRKEVIALAQTYFAVQTRKQELSEKEYLALTEDEKRLYQRDLTRKGNYSLNQTAKKAGVKDFAKFHNSGYKGLYNGETADDIAKRKGLRYREDILDNMCSEELIANLFRISQTEQKLKRDKTNNEPEACDTHYIVGKQVRKAIEEIGGTMPEDLPTPDKSIKELEKEKNILKLTEE
ncbi:MAG: DNA damage-inducible protein D [Clostridia bacterium]|nr:DNA damage-inducible protein D [Clostridia bacterium]